MKNSSTKWLLVTFLIGISVLCFALYEQYFTSDTPPDTPPAAAEPESPDPPQTEPEQPTVTRVYSEFPKKAEVYEGMVAQNVGGLGCERLFETYAVGDNYYVFFDSTSDSYDVNSDGATKTVCMAKINSKLTLESVSVIATEQTVKAVKITPTGFFVATAAEDFGKIYDVSFDGAVQNQAFTDLPTDAKMYLTNGEVLCFLTAKNKIECLVYSNSFDLLRSYSKSFSGAESINSVLPSATGYTVAACSDSGFTLFNFDRNSGFNETLLSVNGTLCNFEPIIYNNSQCYLLACLSDDAFAVTLLDSNFDELYKTTLNRPEQATAIPVEDGFLLITTDGDQTKWLLYCEHLDFVLNLNVNLNVSRLCFHQTLNDGERLCFESDGSLVYATFKNGNLAVEQAFEGASGGIAIDGVLCFNANAKNGFFKKSFGDDDVYVLKPAA